MPIEIKIDANNKKLVTQALKKRLSELGHEISTSHALEAIAALAGHKSWNVASTYVDGSNGLVEKAEKGSLVEEIDITTLLSKGSETLSGYRKLRLELDEYLKAVNHHLKLHSGSRLQLKYHGSDIYFDLHGGIPFSCFDGDVGKFAIPLKCYPIIFDPSSIWETLGYRQLENFSDLKHFISDMLSSPMAAEVLRKALQLKSVKQEAENISALEST